MQWHPPGGKGMTDLERKITAALEAIANGGDLETAQALQAALQTGQGRKAAGLPRRGRGKTYDPDKAAIDSIPFGAVLQFALGETTHEQTILALIAYMGEEMDSRTADIYLQAILPRAQKVAAFIAHVKDAK
jgi:hypothetical protein